MLNTIDGANVPKITSFFETFYTEVKITELFTRSRTLDGGKQFDGDLYLNDGYFRYRGFDVQTDQSYTPEEREILIDELKSIKPGGIFASLDGFQDRI